MVTVLTRSKSGRLWVPEDVEHRIRRPPNDQRRYLTGPIGLGINTWSEAVGGASGPAPPVATGLIYTSAWVNGTGVGGAQILDAGKWTGRVNGPGPATLTVLASTGLGFPATMTNVLRWRHDDNSANVDYIYTDGSQIPRAPGVGQFLFGRCFIRVVDNGAQTAGWAPQTFLTHGHSTVYHSWTMDACNDTAGKWPLAFRAIQNPPAAPYNATWLSGSTSPGAANLATTYALQWSFQRTSNGIAKLRIQWSNADGTGLVTESSFNQGGSAWSTGNPDLTVAEGAFREMRVGASGPYPEGDCLVYLGGVVLTIENVSTNWIGVAKIAGEIW